YEFFKEHILKGADFAASAQTLQGTAQIIQAVANERKGIGYGGAAYGKGVKHLKIKTAPNSPGIVACEDTILRGSYPIWRYLYIYVNPALDKGEVASYLAWVRSEEGQKLVKDIGYYPLPPSARQK